MAEVRIDEVKWKRMIAITTAAECLVEAVEIVSSLPFRGLIFGYNQITDAEAANEYNKAMTQLFRAVKGIEVEDAEPVTTSIAAMIRSVPGLSEATRALLLKGLLEEDAVVAAGSAEEQP